jgi:hypothetical protein
MAQKISDPCHASWNHVKDFVYQGELKFSLEQVWLDK